MGYRGGRGRREGRKGRRERGRSCLSGITNRERRLEGEAGDPLASGEGEDWEWTGTHFRWLPPYPIAPASGHLDALLGFAWAPTLRCTYPHRHTHMHILLKSKASASVETYVCVTFCERNCPEEALPHSGSGILCRRGSCFPSLLWKRAVEAAVFTADLPSPALSPVLVWWLWG